MHSTTTTTSATNTRQQRQRQRKQHLRFSRSVSSSSSSFPSKQRQRSTKNATATTERKRGRGQRTALVASTSSSSSSSSDIAGNPFEQTTQAASERQDLFNDIAPVYDQLNDVLSLGLHRAWKRATVKWSEARKGDTVLDVCCGSGDIAQRLSDRVGDKGTVFGLDFAENQLRRAAEKMEEKTPSTSTETNTAKITWVQGDALDLPFEDDTFDAITMGYGLRNVRDIPKALSELKRVAKSGTKVAILDFNNSRDETTNQVSGFILDNVVVPFAKMNDVEAEYKYLRPSIERFPTGPELVDLALAAGFEEATHYELQPGGLMGCLVCQV